MFELFTKKNDADAIDYSINRFSLKFYDSELESKFSQAYFRYNLVFSRAAHLIAIFFYCLVGLWDTFVVDPARLHIWIFVAPSVSIFFLLGLYLSFFGLNFYSRYWQQIFAFYVLITGIGFTAVTIASSSDYPAYNFVGIIFCLFFCYTFIRLTFIWAVLSGNAIVAIYAMGAGMIAGTTLQPLFTGIFYMFGINLLGMIVCYTLEFMSRRDFILNNRLKHAEAKTNEINSQLEQIVQDRTHELNVSNQDLAEALEREQSLSAVLKSEQEQLQRSLDSIQQAESIARLGYFERNWGTGEGYWSRGFYNLFGLDYASKAPTHEAFMQLVHTEDREHVAKHIQDSLLEKTDMDIEFRGLKDSGDIIQIHGVAHNIFDANEKPIISRGIFRDITDKKQAEKEKIKLENQLQQAYKMESIGTLAGGIAHDFNNILSSIIGFTELALDDVDKDSMIEDNLQEVYTAGKRAKDLVAQILAFARQSEEELKPIQIDVIIKEVLQFIRSSIPTDIEIKKNIDSDSLIKGNQTQVHQIMMNLCTNAAHAMADDGGTLDVTLKDIVVDEIVSNKLDLNPGNYIKLTVSDTGVGIPPGIINSIFEPYFTTKAPGEGTGMGLAMVQGIIESYGGKITVGSQVGEGTAFTIYIPVTRKRKIQRQYEPEELPVGIERILFIDDEAPIANMGSQGLERLGYQVTSRTSSVEALELFKTKAHDFDLIITDMHMPNMTGDVFAREIMKIKPDIPVILCTGYSKKISDETALKIGIKAFVYKPVVKADLAKTVRKVLDEAKGSSHD